MDGTGRREVRDVSARRPSAGISRLRPRFGLDRFRGSLTCGFSCCGRRSRALSRALAGLDIDIRFPLTIEQMGGVWPGYTASRAVSAVPYACAAPTGIRATVDPQIVTRPGRGLRRSGGSDVQAAVLACQATPGRSPARPGSRHADGSGTSPDRCRPGWGNDYFFPFLLFFLPFLVFLATRITRFPTRRSTKC